jgi:hypothetical protein
MLCRLDTDRLDLIPVARLSRGIDHPVWAGPYLYGTVGAELVKVDLPP